jgi:hypothetical protein
VVRPEILRVACRYEDHTESANFPIDSIEMCV